MRIGNWGVVAASVVAVGCSLLPFGGRSVVFRGIYPNHLNEFEISHAGGWVRDTARFHWRDGKLKYSAGFKKGKRHGVERTYYPNGNLHIERHWKGGREILHHFREFDPLGNPISRWAGDSTGGAGILFRDYPDGKPKQKVPVVNGLRHGTAVEWDLETGAQKKIIWKHGMPDTVNSDVVVRVGAHGAKYRRSDSTLLAVAKAAMPDLQALYRRALDKGAFSAGVTMQFAIDAEGRVQWAIPIHSTTIRHDFIEPAIQCIMEWTFPPSSGPDLDRVTMPITLR